MQTEAIQRQYDEIIASHYDVDPQSVLGDSLDRALRQIEDEQGGVGGQAPLKVLDLGMGTGRFLEKLRARLSRDIQPFGLDLSPRMIAIARDRIPDLVPAVDDVLNLDGHFEGLSFGLVCTHFITGFVPLQELAPKVRARLDRGGLWSFVGGTTEGFPVLHGVANKKLVQRLFGFKTLKIGDYFSTPADQAEVIATLEQSGFAVRACETFCPGVRFRNWNEFLEFAYYGGWLTPFVEGLGLHKVRPLLRALLNQLFFPLEDEHRIVIALARKE
jgi:SAM-dependent methyltransferase